MGIIALASGLMLALSAVQMSSNVLDFVDGFVVGVEKGPNFPDQCATDTKTFISTSETLISDIQAAIAGNSSIFTQLLQDVIDLSNDFDSVNSVCDFTDLIADLQALTTVNGAVALVRRFVDNAKEVGDYVKVLQQCSANYTNCGAAVGHIFSSLVGYHI